MGWFSKMRLATRNNQRLRRGAAGDGAGLAVAQDITTRIGLILSVTRPGEGHLEFSRSCRAGSRCLGQSTCIGVVDDPLNLPCVVASPN